MSDSRPLSHSFFSGSDADSDSEEVASVSETSKQAELDEALYVAAQRGAMDGLAEVKRLLAAGASPHWRCSREFGYTALHVAAFGGHDKIAQLLLHAGANVDELDNDRETPLLRVSAIAVLRLLLRATIVTRYSPPFPIQ